METKTDLTTQEQQFMKVMSGFFQGTWKGDGMDTFPTPQGPVKTAYIETMTFGALFATVNPGGGPISPQTLIGVHYYTQLINKATQVAMHQETGYWLFDILNGTFRKAIAIPRGITILAGGTFKQTNINDIMEISASAQMGAETFGICNEPFLMNVAPTTSFSSTIKINETALYYYEDSILKIQGQDFNHTDEASLIKQI
jgi:hypothetical protein